MMGVLTSLALLKQRLLNSEKYCEGKLLSSFRIDFKPYELAANYSHEIKR